MQVVLAMIASLLALQMAAAVPLSDLERLASVEARLPNVEAFADSLTDQNDHDEATESVDMIKKDIQKYAEKRDVAGKHKLVKAAELRLQDLEEVSARLTSDAQINKVVADLERIEAHVSDMDLERSKKKKILDKTKGMKLDLSKLKDSPDKEEKAKQLQSLLKGVSKLHNFADINKLVSQYNDNNKKMVADVKNPGAAAAGAKPAEASGSIWTPGTKKPAADSAVEIVSDLNDRQLGSAKTKAVAQSLEKSSKVAEKVHADLERIEADVKANKEMPQEKKDAVLEKTADMKDKAAAASDKTLSKEDRAKNMKELLGKLKGTKDFMKINLAVFEYNEKNKAINKKDGKSEATKSVLDDMSLERESEELVDHVTQDLERIETDIKANKEIPAEKKAEVLKDTAAMKESAAAVADKDISKKSRAENMKDLLKKLKSTKDFMKINLAVFEYNEKNKALNKKDGKSEATKSVLDDMSLEREEEDHNVVQKRVGRVIDDIMVVKSKITESEFSDLEKEQMLSHTENMLAQLSNMGRAKTHEEREHVSKTMKGELKAITAIKDYFSSLEREAVKKQKPSDNLKQTLRDLEKFELGAKESPSQDKIIQYTKAARDDISRLQNLPAGNEKTNLQMALNIRVKALKDMNSKTLALERDNDTPKDFTSAEGQAKIKVEVGDVLEEVKQSSWKPEVKARVEKHANAILSDLHELQEGSPDSSKKEKLAHAIKLRMAALEKLKMATKAPEDKPAAKPEAEAKPEDTPAAKPEEKAAAQNLQQDAAVITQPEEEAEEPAAVTNFGDALKRTPSDESKDARLAYKKMLRDFQGDKLAVSLSNLQKVEAAVSRSKIGRLFKSKAMKEVNTINNDLKILAEATDDTAKENLVKVIELRMQSIRHLTTMARIPGAEEKMEMFGKSLERDSAKSESVFSRALTDLKNLKSHLADSDKTPTQKTKITKEVNSMRGDLERIHRGVGVDEEKNLKKALSIRMKRLKKFMQSEQ